MNNPGEVAEEARVTVEHPVTPESIVRNTGWGFLLGGVSFSTLLADYPPTVYEGSNQEEQTVVEQTG